MAKKWSGEVTKSSIALDLEEGVFTWSDPRKIALSLKKSADESLPEEGKYFLSIGHEHAQLLYK